MTENRDMTIIKKDFQKVIHSIKAELTGVRLKPMMTQAQMANDTATVNCGYKTEESKELAYKVINDERFIQFLSKHDITAEVETISYSGCHSTYPISQVRLRY